MRSMIAYSTLLIERLSSRDAFEHGIVVSALEVKACIKDMVSVCYELCRPDHMQLVVTAAGDHLSERGGL